jgi:hypothetical protein
MCPDPYSNFQQHRLSLAPSNGYVWLGTKEYIRDLDGYWKSAFPKRAKWPCGLRWTFFINKVHTHPQSVSLLRRHRPWITRPTHHQCLQRQQLSPISTVKWLFFSQSIKIMANFRSRLPELTGRSPSIDLELAQVRSYREPEKVVGASTVASVEPPAFASHWGIVVGGTLYHLTVQRDRGADGSGSPPKHLQIEFRGVSPAKDKIKESKVVGKTKIRP